MFRPVFAAITTRQTHAMILVGTELDGFQKKKKRHAQITNVISFKNIKILIHFDL